MDTIKDINLRQNTKSIDETLAKSKGMVVHKHKQVKHRTEPFYSFLLP